jgi:hypothetical protein
VFVPLVGFANVWGSAIQSFYQQWFWSQETSKWSFEKSLLPILLVSMNEVYGEWERESYFYVCVLKFIAVSHITYSPSGLIMSPFLRLEYITQFHALPCRAYLYAIVWSMSLLMLLGPYYFQCCTVHDTGQLIHPTSYNCHSQIH